MLASQIAEEVSQRNISMSLCAIVYFLSLLSLVGDQGPRGKATVHPFSVTSIDNRSGVILGTMSMDV